MSREEDARTRAELQRQADQRRARDRPKPLPQVGGSLAGKSYRDQVHGPVRGSGPGGVKARAQARKGGCVWLPIALGGGILTGALVSAHEIGIV